MAEKPRPEEKKGKFKINFNPDQLKKFLHSEDKNEAELFAKASRNSRDYADKLGLSGEDVALMERKQGRLGQYPDAKDYTEGAIVKLELDGKKIGIAAKNTACHDYSKDAGWRNMLIAVSEDPSLNKSAGNGTSWINTVPDEVHNEILKAIDESSKNDNLSGELFGFLKK